MIIFMGMCFTVLPPKSLLWTQRKLRNFRLKIDYYSKFKSSYWNKLVPSSLFWCSVNGIYLWICKISIHNAIQPWRQTHTRNNFLFVYVWRVTCDVWRIDLIHENWIFRKYHVVLLFLVIVVNDDYHKSGSSLP